MGTTPPSYQKGADSLLFAADLYRFSPYLQQIYKKLKLKITAQDRLSFLYSPDITAQKRTGFQSRQMKPDTLY
jgi:hypothetical protein